MSLSHILGLTSVVRAVDGFFQEAHSFPFTSPASAEFYMTEAHRLHNCACALEERIRFLDRVHQPLSAGQLDALRSQLLQLRSATSAIQNYMHFCRMQSNANPGQSPHSPLLNTSSSSSYVVNNVPNGYPSGVTHPFPRDPRSPTQSSSSSSIFWGQPGEPSMSSSSVSTLSALSSPGGSTPPLSAVQNHINHTA